jgi:acetyl-CoA carboxylase biotin carboxyl carrier protein
MTDDLQPLPDEGAGFVEGVPVLDEDIAIVVAPPTDDGDTSLLALIDRLTEVLERSDLTELEVEAGGTGLLLRKPIALERAVSVSEAIPVGVPGPAGAPTASPGVTADKPATPQRPSIKAPLTGIFYGAPSPGATAYVSVGDHVSVGQVIGLIEAMKLFNEIKSDLAGRVVRIVADNGALVKAKSPLIEVDPQ